MKKLSVLLAVVLVICAFAYAMKLVRASGTIYIRADGSVEPSSVPIQREGDCYTLTGNITSDFDGITIQKGNVTVDGSDYTLAGSGNGIGLNLTSINNVTIKNINIRDFECGVLVANSSSNIICGNNITGNIESIHFSGASNNNISGNNIAVLMYGLHLDYSFGNIVSENNITDVGGRYGVGISLSSLSSNNAISENNIAGCYYYGISVATSSFNTLSRNNVYGSSNHGIDLDFDSNSNCLSGNNIMNNSYGISVGGSNNNISKNSVSNNHYGIWFYHSHQHNSISENNITDNGYGIYLESSSNASITKNAFFNDGINVQDSCENAVAGNLVNGKPLVYLEAVTDCVVEDAGQVILVNCNRIEMENLSISHTDIGVELWQTNNTKINKCRITDSEDGIYLGSSSGNIVKGNNITQYNNYGIWLSSSSNNIAEGNNVTAKGQWAIGIYLDASSKNNLSRNYIANNWVGAELDSGDGNNAYGNTIAGNSLGIWLSCSNNSICHNNFVNNTDQTDGWSSENVWDNGYPSGGNYWSDYTGVDSNGDGIGESPYFTIGNNQDNYPLTHPWKLGDTNYDGSINILDLVLIAAAIDARPTDPTWNPRADVKQDSRVNLLDLILTVKYFDP